MEHGLWQPIFELRERVRNKTPNKTESVLKIIMNCL